MPLYHLTHSSMTLLIVGIVAVSLAVLVGSILEQRKFDQRAESEKEMLRAHRERERQERER